MRVLLLMRGAPGCGKSTWIEQNGLKEYALSADEIRMLAASAELKPDGSIGISQSNDKFVWDILFRILEQRMVNGEFTIIDATNSKTSEMKRYADYCDRYRYRCYLVDFTDVPIETVKERNKMRSPVKQVPEYVIDNQYSRFETQTIPGGITVIKPDELNKLWFTKRDFSDYKKIHVVGDVHGCSTALKGFLDEVGGVKDDELYIFTGDYIDRGIENTDTLHLLFSIYDKPNVLMLEGNHERWLWKWANGVIAESKEFELRTRSELENGGIDKKDARKFYRKLGQCAYFDYHGDTFMITHGGLSLIPDNLTFVATKQMIRGVGSYDEDQITDETFLANRKPGLYQIHGHRNVKGLPMKVNPCCYNLEGRVEFGGNLRAVTLLPDGSIIEREIKNTVFKEKESDAGRSSEEAENVGDLVIELRKNKYIQEKPFGKISSFNFTRQAFYDKAWDKQTVKARGLYINIPKQKIAARGYAKFFNVNERPETRFDSLGANLSFPVTAYVKENGFLGLVSYDEETDGFFITTKSDPTGEYAGWLRDIFYEIISPHKSDELRDYIKENDVTLAFECVDMEHDPHIIKYDRCKNLFLLDVIKNKIEFEKLPFDKTKELADAYGFQCKERAVTLGSWPEFVDWYNTVIESEYLYNGRHIEGFVLEDADGYMVKLKLAYYNFWKLMRSIAHETIKKGYIDPRRTSYLTTQLANRFYAWIKSVRMDTQPDDIPKDICSLREMYYKHTPEVCE